MLEPESRMTYMEAMRPPPGFHLEKAMGTTFSAELETLILIPLALSSKDGFCDEDGRPNFLALLDSIRRISSRMAVFCQRGRVLLPKSLSKMNAFLNHSLFEVTPPRGSFHPKTWLLHFSSDEGDELYRFICTSRNITSSRSWDTIVVLDGEPYEEESESNEQLVDYLGWLAKQECLSEDPDKAAIVRSFSREIRNVWFSDINPAKECHFDYSRSGARNKPLDLEWLDAVGRLLVISPFLSQEQLEDLAKRLPDNGGEGILVSNIDALKALDWSSEALSKYSYKYYWDDELTSELEENPEELETPDDDKESSDVSREDEPAKLSGLHAKLYIAEAGDNVTLLTGSSNATNAGFRGHNVEFVTVLKGKRKQLGIDTILGTEDTAGSARLCDFLVEFEPPDKPPPVDEAQQKMTLDLESTRRAVAKGEIVIKVQRGDQSRTFDLVVGFRPAEGEAVSLPDGIEGQFWPASLGNKASAKSLSAFINGEEARFGSVGPGEVSKFIAFQLVGRRERVKETRLGFVLGGRFEGEPEGLEEMVVASLIDKPDKFYEYLWFLLLTNYVSVPSIMPGGGEGTWIGGRRGGLLATPLFEDLLSRCVEDPGLVSDIDSLVTTFQSDEQTEEVIPAEFMRVWKEIKDGLTEAGR